MVDNTHKHNQVTITDYQETDTEIEVTVVMKVKLTKPDQSPRLPNQLETSFEIAGQQLKRDLYKWLIERSDDELVARQEINEKIIRHGKIPYSFKTVFGTVAVARNRVKYSNKQTASKRAKWCG